jgi:hypothetical protein
MQIQAAQQSPELSELWMESLTGQNADRLIFIDELVANRHKDDKKHGWALVGATPQIFRPFKRSERSSLLSAYTVDGFVTWEVLQGSFTLQSFENFIEKLRIWSYLLIASLLCFLGMSISFCTLSLL